MKRFGVLSKISLSFLLIIGALAIFAPQVTRYTYDEQNIMERLETSSVKHLMGTDVLGRDLYSRIIYGARLSLAVGVLTALVSLIIGLTLGAISGYIGGWIDGLIMRITDIFQIFPMVLIAILLLMLLGKGVTGIITAIALTSWATPARLVRGLVLQAKELPYVESARALGVSHFVILFRHIIPNLWGPIIVALSFQIPNNIMAESFLSFLGLGLQPPYASWGTLASDGFRAIQTYPHLIIFPGAALFITLLAFNFLGDGLRDWLDPKQSRVDIG